MDFILNEFSLRDVFPNAHAARTAIIDLLQICKKGRDFGMSRLAVRPDFREQHIAKEYTIDDWLQDGAVGKVYKDLLFSIVRQPYIEENDSAIEDRYILSNTFLIGDNDSSKVEGLAIAYLYNTISASFCSSQRWDTQEVSLIFREEKSNDQIVRVRHASKISHVESHKDWISLRLGAKLPTTDLIPKDKEIHVREDHGKDVLIRFSRKLIRSPYIIKVVNSLPFNRHDLNFIKNYREDGIIEIVLVRSDDGYGLAVQTTGTNLIETERISKILEDEFQNEY